VQLAERGVRTRFDAIGHDDRAAFFTQALCSGTADALTCTGDDANLVFEALRSGSAQR
jgi:hypothetical protein